MKIHQLPMGARFEYEGEDYVKTGPLIASGKAGQKLIPKYAVLKPLDRIDPAPAQNNAPLPRARVLAAFERFYAQCRPLVAEDRQATLGAARDGFLKALADSE